MTARVLALVLVAGCLLSSAVSAQEVECYVWGGSGLRRLTFSFVPAAGYTLTGETLIGYHDPPYTLTGTAMTPNGQLLALDPVTPSLVAVDTETAHLTTVVNLNFGTWLLGDIAAVATGETYASSDTRLYKIDLMTGDLTLVGDTGYTLEALGSLDGQLYATGWNASAPTGAFLRLDRLTAQPTVITAYPQPSPFGVVSVGSLSSNWRELWGEFMVHDWMDPYFLGVVDPSTGNAAASLWEAPGVSGVGAVEVRWSALQRQAIPVLSRPMLALLALVLAAAGFVAIRKLAG